MDGYLKIKTKIDNKEVDKGIVELENKIKKLQSDNASLNTNENVLQKEIDQYEELQKNAEEYKNKIKDLQTEREKLSAKFSGEIPYYEMGNVALLQNELEQTKQKYSTITKEVDKQAPKIDKVYQKLDKVKAKQTENNVKITQFKQKIESIKTGNIQSSLNSVGKNLQGQIGKLGKMAMAVVGIRTAWYAVRGAVNAVAQYNEQVSTDFEYMRYVIANMLTPAVQGLIRLLYTLLSYVNAIANAWFGVNLFGNASVKNFKKMQNSAGSTAKSAKEIKKSLQGFDEMNILSDNSSGASGSGVNKPGMDLSGIQGDVPAWLQWIMDNRDIILATIAGIAGAIVSLKLLTFLAELGLIEKTLLGIKAIGIGVTIAGVILLIQDVIKLINDPSFDNILNVLRDIAIVVAGIALTLAAWPVVIGAIIALIVIEVIRNWDKIKEILGKVGQWIYDNVLVPVCNFIWAVLDTIFSIITLVTTAIGGIFTALIGIVCAPFTALWKTVQDVFKGIKTIIQGIFTVFKGIFTGDMKTVLNGFKQIFKGIFDSLWAIAKYPLNLIISGINALIKGANKIRFDVPDWVPGLGGKQFGFNIKQIPLLAKGAVISQPTQAIIGEAGTEAVVPLENNLEWLDILADKLASRMGNNGGSYVIQLNGRTIQRGIAKQQQELAFAMNGR